MSRRIYVHRLIITKPDGSDEPGWRPERWADLCVKRGWIDDDYEIPPFRWPRQLNYFSATGAERKARFLRYLGVTVRIASRAVDFSDLDVAA